MSLDGPPDGEPDTASLADYVASCMLFGVLLAYAAGRAFGLPPHAYANA